MARGWGWEGGEVSHGSKGVNGYFGLYQAKRLHMKKLGSTFLLDHPSEGDKDGDEIMNKSNMNTESADIICARRSVWAFYFAS